VPTAQPSWDRRRTPRTAISRERERASGASFAGLERSGEIPCILYAAKSTEDPRGSIPDQLRECREAIERESGRAVVAEYTDEAVSAFSRSRGPGLVEAMRHAEELAQEGAIELWAQHSDRLAR
jgi:hypothetical protein